MKYLQLPLQFSEELLRNDLSLIDSGWQLHFNRAHYTGDWSAIPLRSQGGVVDNIIPENISTGKIADTPLLNECHYLRQVLQQFPCELNAVRLLKLAPGAEIKEHRDVGLCFEQGEARLHIPVTTNPDVEFCIDGEQVTLLPGTCWYLNFDLPHRLSNRGTTDRVHLIIDLQVNDWVRSIFGSTSIQVKKTITKSDEYTPNDKKGIIRQLLEMNTPASIQLARELSGDMAQGD